MVVPVVVVIVVVVMAAVASGLVAPWRGLRSHWRGIGRVSAGVSLDQVLELAAVEEDAATFRALIDGDAVALVRAHGALALGTGQRGHGTRVTDRTARATQASAVVAAQTRAVHRSVS